MKRAISISLKIPDNTAYTALVALRRLGVAVDRVERSEIYLFDDGGDASELARRVMSDETIFNPNKHRLSVLENSAPGSGEVWIESLASERVILNEAEGPHAIAWHLFDAQNGPVRRSVLAAAIERLLCNPAIERAVTNRDHS
jgi:phosphoribosylformylglycinamidine (FGAM) synthase PurS component